MSLPRAGACPGSQLPQNQDPLCSATHLPFQPILPFAHSHSLHHWGSTRWFAASCPLLTLSPPPGSPANLPSSKPKPKHYLLYEAFPDPPVGSCLLFLHCHHLCFPQAGPPHTIVKAELCPNPGGVIHIDSDRNGTLWSQAAQVPY